MSAVQRDYVERMIEQAGQAFARILELVRAGDLEPALNLVNQTLDLVLGPRRPVLERVDAASAVDLVGKYELDRLRLFAALLGEEGAIRELQGKAGTPEQSYRHALDLYAAISLAGARLQAADRERIVLLLPKVEAGTINERFRLELQRLADEGAPSDDRRPTETETPGPQNPGALTI